MVNAKNAFVGTMLAGIIIAAVGSEKFHSGNWDTMSGDFTYTNPDAKFTDMSGRYYAENTQGCTITETGATAKGTECDMHAGLDYQIEMTNGELEWFATNDVITITNLQTGEKTTTKAIKEETTAEEDGSNEWTVVDGKLTQKDGTVMDVTNAQAPGRKIRDLWGGFRCGFGFSCWSDYLWEKWTTCEGLFWVIVDNIIWCIGWIIFLWLTGVVTVASFGAATPAFIIGLAGFTTHCVNGTIFAIIVLLGRCSLDVLWWLFGQAGGDDCGQFGRNLGGMGGYGSGSGGGYGSGNEGCGNYDGGCRVVRTLGGGCRSLGGGGGGPGPECGDCRMLNRDLGGGCRALGGGGGGGKNCEDDSSSSSTSCGGC